jgi:hypothetical protein
MTIEISSYEKLLADRYTTSSGRCRMGTNEGLNNKDLGLELEINGDLRLSNRGLMKKLGSLGRGVVAPAAPLWIYP